MTLQTVLLTNFAGIAAAILLLWFVSLLRRDASIVDIFWGLGFVLVGWLSLWTSGRFEPRGLLLVGLVSIWGLRLAGYLAWRNLRKPEDYRYAAMRQRHGKRFAVVSLFTVFGLQGLLMWIIALPIQIGVSQAEHWHVAVPMGVILWAGGLFFEAVGEKFLPGYFAKCSELLKPDGMMCLQAITIPDHRYDGYRKSVDFIQRYIFPGGFLPSMGAIGGCLGHATDFRLFQTEDFGPHYADTLSHCRHNFWREIDAVKSLGFDERFIRTWHSYLCYCEAGFSERQIGVSQIILTKPACRRAPVLAAV